MENLNQNLYLMMLNAVKADELSLLIYLFNYFKLQKNEIDYLIEISEKYNSNRCYDYLVKKEVKIIKKY